jgi:hypothetical protein
MKKILSILSLLLLITACDDGDITVDVIDFSEVAAQKCSAKDVIYKVRDAEMLFLEIPAATFTNNETLEGTPIVLTINATNKVTYRKYDGTVTANNICPTVPDGTPNVTEQWTATAGTIEITSTAIKTTNSTTHATQITGYKYYIVLKNITFQKPSGPQTYETFIFGNYNTTVTPLAFGFDDQADKSTCDNRIFNFSGNEAFILDVGANFPTLFPNSPVTTTQVDYINATNKLTYKLFSGTINDAYFCSNPVPAIPALAQEWNAVDGVEAVSGRIEVSTTPFGPTSFQHTIHLIKVTLKQGNSTFTLGDDYIYGSFTTNI